MRALRHLRRAHERSCAEQESAHIGLVGTVAIDFDRGATNELAARRRLDDIGHRPVERHAEIERERVGLARRSEEHTSELQSLMRISYAVLCLKKKNKKTSPPI